MFNLFCGFAVGVAVTLAVTWIVLQRERRAWTETCDRLWAYHRRKADQFWAEAGEAAKKVEG